MSLNTITPPLGQTGPLAEIAKKESGNNKLLVAGITLLVIALIGLLVGLGLVIGGLTLGSSFLIAGASVIGTSVLGIGIAALLLKLSKSRSEQFFKKPLQIVEKKLLVSSKEADLKNQLAALKTRHQKLVCIRDEEKENWRTEILELRTQIKQLNTRLNNVIGERTQQNSENVRLISSITSLQQKNKFLRSDSQALVIENEKLKNENEKIREENTFNGKFLDNYMQEKAEIKRLGEKKKIGPRDPIFDSEWLVK